MKEERSRLYKILTGVDYLKPVPSQANFILCEVVKGKASNIQDDLEKTGYSGTPL